MHYYKRNIGDHASKAKRMSILQHGVYNLLKDECIKREEFPKSEEDAVDWIWADSEEEVLAVRYVLKRLFKFKDGHFVDEDIEKIIIDYQSMCEKNSKNGKSGGRPKKKPDDSEESPLGFKEKQEKPSGFSSKPKDNPDESQKKPKPITTNQELKTNNQIYTGPEDYFTPFAEEWKNHEFLQSFETGPVYKIERLALLECSTHSFEEVKKAIRNYGDILGSQKHFYDHKFTLAKFLEKAISSFYDSMTPFENYRDKSISSVDQKSESERFLQMSENQGGACA